MRTTKQKGMRLVPPVLVLRAPFRGERLQLAREFRGFTQKELAKAADISHSLVSDYETGKRSPGGAFLDSLESILGFTAHFFSEKTADPYLSGECNFRHRRTTPEKMKTQVRAHASLIGLIIEGLRRQFAFPAVNIPAISAVSNEEVEAAAEKCRVFWDIDPYAPISRISRLLENAGVIIVPGVISAPKVDAFSRTGKTPMVFLNYGPKKTATKLNFDIGHECGHLVMHEGIPTGTEGIESSAERFSGALLMPRRSFTREFQFSRFSWQHMLNLKMRWNVSASAVVRRAYELDLLSEAEYRRAFQQMSALHWTDRGEPNEPIFEGPELFFGALAALGKSVRMTKSELCRSIGMSTKTFSELTNATCLVETSSGQ